MKCTVCNHGTMRATMRELRRSVAGHVFTATVPALRCDACSEGTIDGTDLERFEVAIARALLDAGIVAGSAFKYARKAVGLRAVDLAALLGVTPETISRWETERHQIDPAALAVLALLVRDAAIGSTVTLEALRDRAKPRPLAKRVTLKLAS